MALNFRSIGNAVRGALRLLDRLGGSAPGTFDGPAATPAQKPAARSTRKPGTKSAGKRPGQSRPGLSQSGQARPGLPRAGAQTGAYAGAAGGGPSGPYPGDFRGTASVRYAPAPNGLPEPGEIVWTWVPYEEDYSQGKDRPVLLVGTSGRHLLGLMLTSKDHDGDTRQGDDYVDIGTGPWDRQWRPSEAKLDRILQIDPKDVRREGAILDAGRFSTVASALRERHGWS
ncbi:type II toxin-antitoxin system PemK/MazF family toxin [Arthrobacter sp. ov118]|uniref:type II toxin-antitoxin system PemK/MazF family toxin n=1 Tax=Arthrobacter sp. ov118 TaxID=1761747 RepID=UPI0008E9A230|nr:type II toxin-antitoxin system PemK/MazF family toxin [Arthrobacter sp. ov118]SFT71465.1 PemK-like, MazF-like toxin of type II toxin-antitoxin system [Arthrobacter sp. ov118]